jgi:hypothetical protein
MPHRNGTNTGTARSRFADSAERVPCPMGPLRGP